MPSRGVDSPRHPPTQTYTPHHLRRSYLPMFKRVLIAGLSAAALAASLAACGGSSHANAAAAGGGGKGLPTVTMMVGGIDKQIYLPYQLAQDLGYFNKYGVNMKLS